MLAFQLDNLAERGFRPQALFIYNIKYKFCPVDNFLQKIKQKIERITLFKKTGFTGRFQNYGLDRDS